MNFPSANMVHRAYLGRADKQLRFQYNPPKFKDSNSVNYVDVQSIGMSYPVVQYMGGNTRRVTFDFYVNGTAGDGGPQVVHDAEKILWSFSPRQNQQQFKSPDTLLFAFGPFVVECLLESWEPTYTQFAPDLEPLEATFSISLIVVQS